jgi:hypothetical protein
MGQRDIAITCRELGQPIPECIDIIVDRWAGGIREWKHVVPRKKMRVCAFEHIALQEPKGHVF